MTSPSDWPAWQAPHGGDVVTSGYATLYVRSFRKSGSPSTADHNRRQRFPHDWPRPHFTANTARTDRLSAVWVIALTLGLRRAELLGLTWSVVDLDAGTLRVAQGMQRVGGALVLDELKSERSHRTEVEVRGKCAGELGPGGGEAFGGRVAVAAGQAAHLLDQFEQVLPSWRVRLGPSRLPRRRMSDRRAASKSESTLVSLPTGDGCRKSPQVLAGHPLHGAEPPPGQVGRSRSRVHIGD
jgi:hypothetical protein